MVQVTETKEYKYAIIIDGLAYVLSEYPRLDRLADGMRISCGSELEAEIPFTVAWVIVPYEDWLAANGPGSWKRNR